MPHGGPTAATTAAGRLDTEEAAEMQEQELRSGTFELLRQKSSRALRPFTLPIIDLEFKFNYQYQFIFFFFLLSSTVAAILGGRAHRDCQPL